MTTPLVPIAISSQLDVSGIERIHVAQKSGSITTPRPVWHIPNIFSWRAQPVPSSYYQTSAYVSGNTIAVTPYTAYSVMYSLDRGYNWTLLSDVLSTVVEGINFSGVVAYKGDWYVFAAGSVGRAGKASGNSFAFNEIAIPFNPYFTGPNAFVANGYIYVVDGDAATNYKLYRFDGTTWLAIDTSIPIRSGAGAYITSIQKAGSNWLLGTDDGYVLKTNNFSTFSIVFTEAAGLYPVASICSLGADTLVTTKTSSQIAYKIYRSTDNGLTFDAGTAFAAGVPTGATDPLLYTMSNGAHFMSGYQKAVNTSTVSTAGSWAQRLAADLTFASIRLVGMSTNDLAVYPTFGDSVYIGDANG